MSDPHRRWPVRAVLVGLLLVPAGLLLPRVAPARPVLAALVCLAAMLPVAAVLGYAAERISGGLTGGRSRRTWRAVTSGSALLVVGLVLAASGGSEIAVASWVGSLVGVHALLPGLALLFARRREGQGSGGELSDERRPADAVTLLAGAAALSPTLLHPEGKPPGGLSALSCLVLLAIATALWWGRAKTAPSGHGVRETPARSPAGGLRLTAVLFVASAGLLGLLARALAPVADPALAELGMGPVAGGMLLLAPVTGVAQVAAARWVAAAGESPRPRRRDRPWLLAATLPALVLGVAVIARQGFAGLAFGKAEAVALAAATVAAAWLPRDTRHPLAMGVGLVGLAATLMAAPYLLGY